MSVVINTNSTATVAANNLSAANSMLQKSISRLSTGSKITSAADDSGGLAVSMKLAAAARRQGAVSSAIGNAVSLLQTQEGSLKISANVLDRISELKTLYTDITKSSSDKANYDTEFVALTAQLTANASDKFNGVSLFGSAAVGTVAITEAGDQTISIAARNLTSSATGVGVIASTSVTSLGASAVTLDAINEAIQRVGTMRAANGAEQSRLGFAGELNTINKANLEAANSRIVDVDVAEESTQLARFNILVQAGTSMLAQANQSAQAVLKLIQ
jgi:flagellin